MLRAFGRILTSSSRQQRLTRPLLAADVYASLDFALPELQSALPAFNAAPYLCQQAQVRQLGNSNHSSSVV